MLKVDELKCFGCGNCYISCPKKCIEMKANFTGFLRPVFNESLCANCGICEKVCPSFEESYISEEPAVYLSYNLDEDERLRSSSGAIFVLLAKNILHEEGIVFGAALDSEFNVKHISVEHENDLSQLLGSKYAQSALLDTFSKVMYNLNTGRKVLFSGTPCQVAALKKYLNADYQNLVTISVVCHGVASPKIWKLYLESICNGRKITSINLRNKRLGWKNYGVNIKFNDDTSYFRRRKEDVFMRAYLSNLILRDSCYDCQFNIGNSGSDISLGDFWGIDKLYNDIDIEKGVSLVCINSKKGAGLFENIKNRIYMREIDSRLLYNLNVLNLNHIRGKECNKAKRNFYFKYVSKNNIKILTEYCTFLNLFDLLKRLLKFIKYRI